MEQIFPTKRSSSFWPIRRLRGQGGKKLEEFQVFLLWKDDRARLCVDQPPQNLCFAGPVALACHQLLDADGILGFARQGQKSILVPGPCRQRLHVVCDHIIHVAIDVGEAIQGV